MVRVLQVAAWLTAAGVAAALIGCGRTNTSSTTPAGGGPPIGMKGWPGMPGAMGGPVLKIDEASPHAAGQKVFAANNCARCHAINGARLVGGGGPMAGGPPGGFGPGGPKGDGTAVAGGPKGPFGPGGPMPGFGPMMKGGPDLGHVGKDPEHTVDWFVRLVGDPKSVRPDAKMPAFGTKIGQPEMRSLAEYLASLK
jgi:mono/diheme cytochrome c family protein